MIVIPINTAMKRVLGTSYLHEMAIQAATPEEIPQMMIDVETLMRKRHRLPMYKQNDFTLRNNAEVQKRLKRNHSDFFYSARNCRGNFFVCGRHRHHEHHARIRQ